MSDEEKKLTQIQAIGEGLMMLLAIEQQRLMKDGDTERAQYTTLVMARITSALFGEERAEEFLDGATDGYYSKHKAAQESKDDTEVN